MSEMKWGATQSLWSLEDDVQSAAKYARTPTGTKQPTLKVLPLSEPRSRRTLEKSMWRRSWGFCGDENAVNILNNSNVDLRKVPSAPQGMDDEDGEVKTYLEDYAGLCEWLNSVQKQRGSTAAPHHLNSLGAELLKHRAWRTKMNEGAKLLLQKWPKLSEELGWRLKHLNSQWDALEKILLCGVNNGSEDLSRQIPSQEQQVPSLEEPYTTEWLKEWLTTMESRLEPLHFRTHWTPDKLSSHIRHHKELQEEIEEESARVHEVLRCPRGGGGPAGTRGRLHTRWLQLRLRVLEWNQHLASLQRQLNHPTSQVGRRRRDIGSGASGGDSSSEEEPRSKAPRLDRTHPLYPAPPSLRLIMGQSVPLSHTHHEGEEGKEEGEEVNISTYYFKHSDTEPEPPISPLQGREEDLEDDGACLSSEGVGDEEGWAALLIQAEELVKTTPPSPTTATHTHSKKSVVRKWLRAAKRKGTTASSSCDASAESDDAESALSASPSSSSGASSSSSEFNSPHHQSVLDTTMSSTKTLCPSSVTASTFNVPMRHKKTPTKQRPKSFTESSGSGIPSSFNNPNIVACSDTALHTLVTAGTSEWMSSSSGDLNKTTPGQPCQRTPGTHSKQRRLIHRRRHSRRKSSENLVHLLPRRSFSFEDELEDEEAENIPPSHLPNEDNNNDQLGGNSDLLKPCFRISGPVTIPLTGGRSDNTNKDPSQEASSSLNTTTDGQDWDSYQEKYLSEVYSEGPDDCPPHDPSALHPLLAFGEDYDQVLGGSCPSPLSTGRRPPGASSPPVTSSSSSSASSSSDEDSELTHHLTHSAAQLRFLSALLPSEDEEEGNEQRVPNLHWAEMRATAEENVRSLRTFQGVGLPPLTRPRVASLVSQWETLGLRLRKGELKAQVASLHSQFASLHSSLSRVDPFEANDLRGLQVKVDHLTGLLEGLKQRKSQLVALNEAARCPEGQAEAQVKAQLEELYALYEENFQLGHFLLEKMRRLHDAWETFEREKAEFERTTMKGGRGNKGIGKGQGGSISSADSGHGTDASSTLSSDSEADLSEKRQRLAALKKRASEVKAFLPPGSPVFDVIQRRVWEAEKGLEDWRIGHSCKPQDLRILYPKNTFTTPSKTSNSSRVHSKMSSSKLKLIAPRRWRVVRRMVVFNFALMGLFLAAAWILAPRCCEHTNTFCLALVPHLTHETLPPI